MRAATAHCSMMRCRVSTSQCITLLCLLTSRSYVCDVAPRAQRTQKIGRLMSMNYFGFFVGSMTAGALLEFHGFYVIFAAVLVLQIACAVVAVRYLKTNEQIAADRLEADDSRVTAVVCSSDAANREGGQGVRWAAVVTQGVDGDGVTKQCCDSFGEEKGKLSNEVRVKSDRFDRPVVRCNRKGKS
jgi:hypothetical protein